MTRKGTLVRMRYAPTVLATLGLMISPWLVGCSGEASADPVPAAPGSQPTVEESGRADPAATSVDATWIVYTLPG